MFFGRFYESTFKQYIIVGPVQKEKVRSSKLSILHLFEICGDDLEKNPIWTENTIRSFPYRLLVQQASAITSVTLK